MARAQGLFRSLGPEPRSRPDASVRAHDDGADGAFLYVPSDVTIPMTLRVRDLSRNAESFGAEVPIRRIEDFAPSIIITDVPTDSRFRATLRVYGATEQPRELMMRVFTLAGDEPIEERNISLSGILHSVPDPTPLHPGYAEIDPLTPAVRAEAARVRIELSDSVSPAPPFWALVSITNNETQQVTMITPHP